MTLRWKLRRTSSTAQSKADPSFGTNSFSSLVLPTNGSPRKVRESSFLMLDNEKERIWEKERSFLSVEPEVEKESSFFSLRRKARDRPSVNSLPESWIRPDMPRSSSNPAALPGTIPIPALSHVSPSRWETSLSRRSSSQYQVDSPRSLTTPDEWYHEALAALRLAEAWEWPYTPSRSPEALSASNSEETLGPATPTSAEMVLHGEVEYEEAQKRRMRFSSRKTGESLSSSLDGDIPAFL